MKTYHLRVQEHDDLLQDMLLARGITNAEAVVCFLEPDFERDSHDPFCLPDMGVAVERILSAKTHIEKIAVWSDYDCDGIPGGVLLCEFFRGIGLEVRHYIPHRHAEGYGMNEGGIDELVAAGVTLIITVDLGTTEHEPIAYAKEKGIDVIVTDHHLVSPGEKLPDALAVINPKRPDSMYPFDGLCGAGVAWKLVQAVLMKNRFGVGEGQEKWLLDLAGLGTLSDMVPLVGENRMLATFGLRVMRRARRPGIAALLAVLKIQPAALTEDDIGFMLAPRINAASRMDSPELAARLLTTNSMVEARELAARLNTINDERKGLVASISREVGKRLETAGTPSPLIVMGNPKWRPGVLGLVANTLMQARGGPVFLWGRDGSDVVDEDGLLRGSCRSDGTISVVEVMAAAGQDNFFAHFGGHRASGGFSLTQDKAHELPARLASAFESLRSSVAAVQEVVLDRQLDIADVSHVHKALQKLAPFGIGNTKPLFILPGTQITSVRTFGKNKDHLELALASATQGSSLATLPGVAFFSTVDSFQKKIIRGMCADIVGHVETDWRGGPRVRIVDVI